MNHEWNVLHGVKTNSNYLFNFAIMGVNRVFSKAYE